MHKCLFLDRDGVIHRDVGYACKPEQIEFMPGIFRLCRLFQEQGYWIVIATNQSGIARDYYSEDDFQALQDWMQSQFSSRGINLHAVYHCPHHPQITARCHCRKPQPGMLNNAMRDLQIKRAHAIMIGDKPSDMLAAKRAGIPQRILLRTEVGFKRPTYATMCVQSLAEISKRLRIGM
jgi:D-glycero-D-manno-heptose 1,7-bisphosphate phosphatase